MGDPGKTRKKYETPMHPWVGSRISDEKRLLRQYGLRNKSEVWRMGTTLKRFKDRAKALIARSDEQARTEQRQLLERLVRLGLIKEGAGFDDILGLPLESLLDRRLQSILLKRNLARTPKQARQMIVHRHVRLGGKVVTSPSHLVTLDEEAAISFAPRSAFVNEAHPERFSEEELAQKRAREEAKRQKESAGDDEVATFDEKAIEQAEVLAGEKKVESVKEAVKAEEQAAEQAAQPAPEEQDSSKAAAQGAEEAPAGQEAERSPEQEAPAGKPAATETAPAEERPAEPSAEKDAGKAAKQEDA